MHLRDFAGFEETSRKILMLKPGIMTNWTQFSIACFVNRNYAGCVQAVESLLKFQSEPGSKTRILAHEQSEIVLLAVRAMEAQGKPAEALAYLKKHRKKIVD